MLYLLGNDCRKGYGTEIGHIELGRQSVCLDGYCYAVRH